ncbi:MAG: tetratricopeptide repeat protein [Planctomycetota bacterium]
MRRTAALLLLAAAAGAGPRGLPCVPDSKTAVEVALTRGRMIFLTVIVDGDAENRAVVEDVWKDAQLQKVAEEFVCLYANPDDTHGKFAVKNAQGKEESRCADCPAIECRHHQALAQSYARGFYGDKPVKTPMHFVLDAKEEVVEMIYEGDFEGGFHRVPAAKLVARLEALLKKRGRGLTETQYRKMVEDLREAKAARARGMTALELEKLLAVVALGRDVEGVKEATARLKEIEAEAGAELEKARASAAEQRWEEALDALEKIQQTYPGTLTAAAAAREEKDLRARGEVKRLLQARELYEKGIAFKERDKPEQARKKFEECVRRFAETKYGQLSKKELESLPPAVPG